MIFHPELAARITLGAKTVTRRPVGRRETCRYEPGRTYAVQLRRGGVAIDSILIKAVERQTLELPLTAEEAAREGFDSPAAFEAKWRSLYGNDFPTDVFRIEFEVAE